MNEEFFIERREDRLFSQNTLDYPVSLFPFLTYHIEKNLRRHLLFLKSQSRQVKKIYIELHCERAHCVHLLEVRVPRCQGNVDNIMENVEKRLLELDLENPVCEIDLETIPRKTNRLDEFGQTKNFRTRLTTGYIAPEDAIWSSADIEPQELGKYSYQLAN